MVILNLLKESLHFAWHSLVVNKLRTFLSLLGITIGIFAIIIVFTIVDSLESNIRGSIESLGENVVFVHKWPWSFGPDYPWWKYMNRPVPDITELYEIRRKVKSAEAAAFHVGTRKTVSYRSSSVENAVITGVSSDYDKIASFEISEGRYFTDDDVENGRPIAVIGSNLVEALFVPGEDPVGKEVKIMGRKLRVAGVFKKEGESLLGNSMDNQVLMPVQFIRNLLDIRSERVDPYIVVKAKSGISNLQLKDELTGVLRAVRKLKPIVEDNFSLNETKLLSQNFDGLFEVVGTAGWIIGGFSILVGGFGIANIMFVSVKERTALIGIQKALGARNFFILLQFLFEAVFLSVVGGGIGLILIYIITLFAGDAIGMEISLSSGNLILGVSISLLIGIISGFIPAYSASQLDPVEAMRSSI